MSAPPGPAFGSGLFERQPVIILLDVSASMARPAQAPRIAEVNVALAHLADQVRTQARMRERVEVCLIAFGTEVRVFDPEAGALTDAEAARPERDFVAVDRLEPPELRADGYTCLLPALEAALRLAAGRRRHLTEQRVPVLRPLIWLLTDGAPSDEHGRPLSRAELAPMAERLRAVEAAAPPDDCVFLAIGVRGADQELLEVLAPRGTLMLAGLNFTEILKFLVRSSDRVGPVTTSDDVHEQAAHEAELRRRMRAMEEKLL
ncbi:VWA domain-containing protein [Streptomyces sp. DSM 44915]|uniref:VWA domain-containing protein n=1 Tax=Streptomyces chisholmiae TaxID=3075540 RepID=A0ABU2JRA1_9ACTN|nr:VWA domain-containing protein [Streptomyces sp. DSM 44915]MDT0267506.1 VWA domain-containing protein [Streptomyces sp. DSM 44915]